MEEFGMGLCIHSEVSKAEIDIFDREGIFIQEVVTPLLRDFQKFAHNTNLDDSERSPSALFWIY